MTAELHNDLGHGKNTYPPNKGVPGLPEFEFNSAVGREIKRLLDGVMPTYEAQPFNGYDIPLITRTNNYNDRWERNKDAIGISNHANANAKKEVRGFGVFYWHTSPEARKLAEMLLDEYMKEFPDREQYPIWGTGLFPSKPGTWTDLHMCRETKGIFVLVEWEFMTNPEALKLLKSDDYRKRCALVVSRVARRWFGIPIEQKDGWKKESGKWFFYDKGTKETGWVKWKNKWYFLNDQGEMQNGWIKDKGKWYYLNPDPDKGEMLTGVIKDKGKLYYLNPDGSMAENAKVNVNLKAGKDGSLMP